MSPLSRSTCALLLLLGAGQPAAAGRRFAKGEEPVVAAQPALTRPAPKDAAAPSGPALRSADLFAGRADDLRQVQDSQIKVMQRLLAATAADHPERPDLLFRLAELYADQQRLFGLRARELDEQIFAARQRGQAPQAERLRAQQADHERRERQWLLEAVRTYVEIASGPGYAGYRRMDVVLFQLGRLLTQEKKDDQARVFFRRLVKDHPQSPYLPHAYLSFADQAFEARDLEGALRLYEKVLQLPGSPLHGYALYKKGWVYYNLGDFKGALGTFVAALDQAQGRAGGTPADRQLAREARKDIVRAYAQLGAPEKAWPFFQRHGGEAAGAMLEQLAELYAGQGQFAESIQTYRELVRLGPGSPKLCAWQTEILRGTLSMTGSRAVPETVRELQRLAAVYERAAATRGPGREALAECRRGTAGSLRELATVWHKEAQKTRDLSTYARAADLYREYLRRFGDERDAYLMRWWYGELLYAVGGIDGPGRARWLCEAAPVYDQVVGADPRGAKVREAAYAAVAAWQGCLDDEPDERARREDNDQKDRAPRPIPPRQAKLLAALSAYVRHVPDGAEIAAVRYHQGRIHWAANRFADAVPLLREVAEGHPRSEVATYAAHLLLDSLEALKDISGLEAQLDRLLAMPAYQGNPAFAPEAREIRLSLMRLRIEELAQAGAYRQAGILSLQLADGYPSYGRLAEVYYNAGLYFERARLIGLAIQARERLIALKPDDPLAKRALYRVGQSFQQIASYESAAERYETFATRFPGELAGRAAAERPDDGKRVDAALALRTAAFFRRAMGQTERAAEDVALFVRNYGGRAEHEDEAAGVFFELGQAYEARGDTERLRQHLAEYLRRFGARGGVDRQVVAEAKLGELAWRAACPVPGLNGACVDVRRVRAGAASHLRASMARRLRRGASPGQCGPETSTRVTVHERRPALVKEAMARFGRALALYRQGQGGAASAPAGPDAEARRGAMTYHAALARMAQGDQEYERLLRVEVPGGLVFDPRRRREEQASRRRLKAWIDGKARQLEAARAVYHDVIQLRHPHWVIAAAARVGQLYEDFAGALQTAPVPQPPPPPPGLPAADWAQQFRDAYCDAITDASVEPERKAVEALATCVGKSTELGWFNEWSRLCEAELNQLRPVEYPMASELRPEPGYATLTLDVAPVSSLPTERAAIR